VTPRSRLTLGLWVTLWVAVALLLACEVLDGLRREAPALVMGIKLAPLLVVLPGALRDRMRAVVWLSFVSLLYFLFAVQRVFAEPASPRALLELLAVILVFITSMFYVRFRARERRAALGETNQ
jgi:uncharacterized membrane protein